MDTKKYEDILHLSRPLSSRHPPMSLRERAAQFSPFAALSGYEAAVRETARQTEKKADPDESVREEINRKLQILADHAAEQPEAVFVFFEEDKTKSGGRYVRAAGRVKTVDAFAAEVRLTDGRKILSANIRDIESSLFSGQEFD